MSHVFQETELKPYAGGVPLNGEGMPPLKTVDDWIRYMMTVRERFGSTAMIGKFEVKWGASALWGMDALRNEIEQKDAEIKKLKEDVAWQKKKVTANPPQPGGRVLVEAEVVSVDPDAQGLMPEIMTLRIHGIRSWTGKDLFGFYDLSAIHPDPQPAKKGE